MLLMLLVAGCKSSEPAPVAATPASLSKIVQVAPPPMPQRQIGPPPTTMPGGQLIDIDDNGVRFALFIPQNFTNRSKDGGVPLRMHFHGAIWFAIQEHLRCRLDGPLLCAALGEGSSVYRRPFEDKHRFARLIKRVEIEMNRRYPNAVPRIHIVNVSISSFSAGYGAVREIVKSPENMKAIRRILLADSMYASFEGEGTAHPSSQPAREHIEPWIPFAKEAAAGNKTFVLTYSQVSTQNYASSALCAAALIDAVHAPVENVMPGSSPATLDPQFPLLTRADVRGFHVWGYGGSDAQAHLTHARHIADVWMALDAAGMP
jgi:hypothetical protein